MEKDGVVSLASIEFWLISRIRKGKNDWRAGQQRRRIFFVAQRRQVLARDRVIWVARWARAWHDEHFGCVEDLVGVREDCVDGAGEGRLLPDVDEAPRFVS